MAGQLLGCLRCCVRLGRSWRLAFLLHALLFVQLLLMRVLWLLLLLAYQSCCKPT